MYICVSLSFSLFLHCKMSCIEKKMISKINSIVRYYTIWIMTLFIFFVVNNNNQNCFLFVSSTNINNKSNFNVPKSNTLKIAIMSPRIKKSNGKPVGWSTTSLVATLLAIDGFVKMVDIFRDIATLMTMLIKMYYVVSCLSVQAFVFSMKKCLF